MQLVPYAFVVGSVMYVMLCGRVNICFAVGMLSKYQFNLGLEHLTAIKHILKYDESWIKATKYSWSHQATSLCCLSTLREYWACAEVSNDFDL